MAGISIKQFKGTIPKLSPRLLPDSYAQIAKNCKTDRGHIEPINGLLNENITSYPTSGDIKSIFKNDDGTWHYSSEITDFVKSPVKTIEARYFFTNGYSAYKADEILDAPLPLGVKPPIDPLTIELDPTSSSEDIVRTVSYVYTRVTKWGEESKPSKPTASVDVKSDQTVKLSGFSNGGDPFIESYRVYRVATGTQGANYELVPYQETAGTVQYDERGNVIYDVPVEDVDAPTKYFLDKIDDIWLGEVLPCEDWDTPPARNLVANGDFQLDDDLEDDPAYWTPDNVGSPTNKEVWIPSSDYAPLWMQNQKVFRAVCADASDEVKLTSDEYIEVDEDEHYCLSAWVRNYSGTSKSSLGLYCYDENKNYLSVVYAAMNNYAAGSSWEQKYGVIHPSSETGETYHFPAGTKYVKIRSLPQYQEIGGTLITRIRLDKGQEPQLDLQGLTYVGNGVLAGFMGRTIYFCEPYYYYAWPAKYALSMESDIIGIGQAHGQIVVITEDYVYIIDGHSPESYSITKLESQQGGISRRSIVSTAYGVFFAGQDGLCLVSNGQMENITKNLYTKTQWKDLEPDTLVGFFYDDKYIGFFEGTSTGIIIPIGADRREVITIDLGLTKDVYGGYIDAQDDTLYLAVTDSSTPRVYKWDSDENNKLTFTWRSKKIATRRMQFSFGAIRSSGQITVNLYADGTGKDAVSVDDDIFRLSGGYKAKDWEIEIEGNNTVYSIGIGQTSEDVVGI